MIFAITILSRTFLSVSFNHMSITIFGSVYLHCSAFQLHFLASGVRHLCAICLRYVLRLSSFPSGTPSICVCPLALAPIFIQIHRAVSVRRRSGRSKACSSTSPSHSAPNPLASLCRLSETGERASRPYDFVSSQMKQ